MTQILQVHNFGFCHGGFVENEEEEGEEDDRFIETQEGLTDKIYEDWMDIDCYL